MFDFIFHGKAKGEWYVDKKLLKTGKVCRVTFKYENPEGAGDAALAGEFNGWSLQENPMKKLKDGTFSATVSLDAGTSYRFRYVLEGESWVNDSGADGYPPNDFNEDDSLVTV